MTRRTVCSSVAISVLVLGAWSGRSVGEPAPQSPPERTPASPSQLSNEELVHRILVSIKGHEKEPAAQVFKNIQLENLKNEPASTLLGIMLYGYSHALGVRCTHCHDESDFSKDDKRPKRAAREMAVMHHDINQQLAKMKDLESNPEKRFINCGTCHRGAVKPTER